MTTATRVTINPVAPNAEAMERLTSGLGEALGAMDADQWSFAYDALTGEEIEPKAVAAFQSVQDAVVAEVAPDVARMLAEAMNRRLPWTWEPER